MRDASKSGHVLCQLACQIWTDQKSSATQQACGQHSSALGGIRTPNLLIRRGVPPSQWVAPVPPEYDHNHRNALESGMPSSQ
jgi:hypothetical protein